MTQVAEGIKRTAADTEYTVQMSITGAIGTAINDAQTVARAYQRLLHQSPGIEFWRGHGEH